MSWGGRVALALCCRRLCPLVLPQGADLAAGAGAGPIGDGRTHASEPPPVISLLTLGPGVPPAHRHPALAGIFPGRAGDVGRAVLGRAPSDAQARANSREPSAPVSAAVSARQDDLGLDIGMGSLCRLRPCFPFCVVCRCSRERSVVAVFTFLARTFATRCSGARSACI